MEKLTYEEAVKLQLRSIRNDVVYREFMEDDSYCVEISVLAMDKKKSPIFKSAFYSGHSHDYCYLTVMEYMIQGLFLKIETGKYFQDMTSEEIQLNNL